MPDFNQYQHRSIHKMFEHHATNSPEKTAVVCNGISLTYEELNIRACRLCSYLLEHGAIAGDRIALAIERSADLIIAMLAVLKCGAAYLPIDDKIPAKRNADNLTAAKVRFVIVDDKQDDQSIVYENRILISCHCADDLRVTAAPSVSDEFEAPAYIMFTSGTTGDAKGVVVPHRAVLRLVVNCSFVDIRQTDVFMLLAPVTFDASTFEIWGALLNGATLVIYSFQSLDPNKLAYELNANSVSILWLTAALFHVIAERFLELLSPVRALLAGGDVLRVDCINTVIDAYPEIVVINGYGPTENTTFTCCHQISTKNRPKSQVPIGTPISGTEVYILDEHLNQVPIGDVGQLHTSGLGVALGYLNDENSNGSGFYFNESIASGQIYATGDLVRENAQGDIEYIGRQDNQFKRRGFRVSVEEIEACMNRLDQIVDSVVIVERNVTEDPIVKGVLRLVGGTVSCQSDIKTEFAEFMPEYMIPDQIFFVDHWPVKTNGKIDRRLVSQNLKV